jgi:hypothetical protein
VRGMSKYLVKYTATWTEEKDVQGFRIFELEDESQLFFRSSLVKGYFEQGNTFDFEIESSVCWQSIGYDCIESLDADFIVEQVDEDYCDMLIKSFKCNRDLNDIGYFGVFPYDDLKSQIINNHSFIKGSQLELDSNNNIDWNALDDDLEMEINTDE